MTASPPRTLRVIGIGTGNPEHLTLQAVRALADVDAVFVLDKGPAKAGLVDLRRTLCAAHIAKPYRWVAADDPARARRPADYAGTVEAWHDARAALLAGLIARELAPGEVGAILVWGDPALYDSTLRVLARLRPALAFALEVIPGLSSPQVLAAAHAEPLNRVGAAVHVTTGRRLAAAGGWPGAPDDAVVVMLDADPGLEDLDPDLEILWGAYLGSPDEILRRGRVGDLAAEIRALRGQARARHGWIMDTYLLRRPDGSE